MGELPAREYVRSFNRKEAVRSDAIGTNFFVSAEEKLVLRPFGEFRRRAFSVQQNRAR